MDADCLAIVVRTRNIWLQDAEDKKKDLRKSEGYEEYVFPLSEFEGRLSPQLDQSNKITKQLSIHQDHRKETLYSYKTMGLSTVPINLERKNIRNSFSGIFDFLCEFPLFGAENNRIVFYLKDEKSREKNAYFEKKDLTPSEYKDYFLRKFSQLLFKTLRDYLYHEKPEVMLDGSLRKRPEEDALRKEDMACAEILSFCTCDYPHSDIVSLTKTIWDSTPEGEISATIAFFRKSTYVHWGKSLYDHYLDCVELLFSYLYKIDASYFTALYKLSLPIKATFQKVIRAFDDCTASGDAGQHWADSIIPDFEWFSAGQHQIALMFSGLYQRLKGKYENENTQDLIAMFDEPETHMHPEAGRHFIKTLKSSLTHFQSAGLFRTCQIILATHSPFLIQSLSSYPVSIALTENSHGQITIKDFNNLQNLYLPKRSKYSFNLVMYHIFHVPTIELHDELYGYLQMANKCYDEKKLDNWFLNNTPIKKTKSWISVIDGIERNPQRVTLQRYIRNFIHHPENTKNQEYSPEEFCQSIEEMLKCMR